MTKLRKAVLLTPLLIATGAAPMFAQRHDNSAYYNGVRNSGRGGSYYNNNDRRYHDDHRYDSGGIGPGKGA